MMNLRAIVSCLFLSAAFAVGLTAQNTNTNLVDANANLQELMSVSPTGAGARSFDDRYEGVKGHPYLQTGWLEMRILLREQEDYATVSTGNLDLVEQSLVIGLQDGGMGTIPLEHVVHVEIMSVLDTQLVEPHPLAAVTGKGEEGEWTFFEVLHDGDTRLLLELRKYFEQADYKGAYNTSGNRFDTYSEQYAYHLKVNGEYQEIKLRERPILRALENRAGRARSLIRQNNLDLSRQSDFIRLLELLEE